MSKTDYVAQGALDFSAQLITCKNALGSYKDVLGLSDALVAEQAADADYFASLLTSQTAIQNSSSQWSAWRTIMRAGGTPPSSGAPVAPVLPSFVTVPAPGIEDRFRGFVRQAKASPGYNVAIGKALGIEGSEKGGPDLSIIAPGLTAALVGGQVQIGWGWQGHGNALDMIEILVNRGNGYAPLTYDTTPGYTDSAPFPASPGKWSYKAIYRVGDSQVGQWSAEISLTVGG